MLTSKRSGSWRNKASWKPKNFGVYTEGVHANLSYLDYAPSVGFDNAVGYYIIWYGLFDLGAERALGSIELPEQMVDIFQNDMDVVMAVPTEDTKKS